MTSKETAKTIRLHQLELASKNPDFAIEDVIEMHSILKTYDLTDAEKQQLKSVEKSYGYKQPRDKTGNVKLLLQLAHKWSEYDFDKKLDALQKSQDKLLSLAVQDDSKTITLTDGQRWEPEKGFQEILNQLKKQRLFSWSLDKCIGDIITPRGTTPFRGWLLQNRETFPDIGILIWHENINSLLQLNIYTILLPNNLTIKDIQTITSEALCVKNNEEPSIQSFINSAIKIVHDAIESLYMPKKTDLDNLYS